MMHEVQQLQFEIRNLKEALAASQKKSDRYAQLMATLYDELDSLRSNICHECKKRLAPGIVAGPGSATSPGQNASAATSSSTSEDPFRLPPIDNTGTGGSSDSQISISVPATSLSTPETIPGTTLDTPVPNPHSELETPDSPKLISGLPEFSVEYNPEVKRAFDLHLEHVFAHESPAFCIRMSPDGQRMAVGCQTSGETVVSEMRTKSKVRVFVDRYVKDTLAILSVKFSPDGRFLATGANDGKIRIWDTTRNRMRAAFKGAMVHVNSVAFSPDGRFLVSGSYDRSVRIWNIRGGSSKKLPATKHPGMFLSVVFSPDGRYIAAGDTRYAIWIWDSRTHRLVANWKDRESRLVWCVEFTPDGKGLISGSMDKTAKYWDVSSLGIHGAVPGKTVVLGDSLPLIRSFSGHTDAIYSIAFFPNNNEWIVTASEDKSVRIWDIRTGVWQLVVRGHRDSVREVDVSGTENFLVTLSADRHVTLWRCEVL